jgi:hypothetical protein
MISTNKTKLKRFASWGKKMENLMNLLGRNRKKKDWKLSFARLIIVCWFVEVGRFSMIAITQTKITFKQRETMKKIEKTNKINNKYQQ